MCLTSVKERINKLLATATSENQHEAELAMSMAQALIHKHKLSMAELSEAEAKDIEEAIIQDNDPIFAAGRVSTWKNVLAGALALANDCRIIKHMGQGSSLGGQRGTKTIIYGRPSDIANVRFMLAYAVTQLARLAPVGRGKEYANSWYLGAACAIRERLEATKREAYKGGSQYALVKLQNRSKEVDRFISSTVLNLRKGSPIRHGNQDAFNRGSAVGKGLDMNNRGQIRSAKALGMR